MKKGDVRRLFPEALLTCIREGRSPSAGEISFMAEKMVHEALRHHDLSSVASAAQIAAYAALAGSDEQFKVQAAP